MVLGPWIGFNAALLLGGVYESSYDAYTHIFLADHYRRDWFSLWEPKWYGGFSVTSYPPLAHQLTALLSYVFGLQASYALLTLVTAVALPLAIYWFALIFSDREEAKYALLFAVILPSTTLYLHAFGQLPTIMATVFTLLSAKLLDLYLHGGRLHNLMTASLFAALVASTHHLTFLFFLPTAWLIVFLTHVSMREPSTVFKRFLSVSLLTSTLASVALYPFIVFALTAPPQAEIPHATRGSIFEGLASVAFLWGTHSFTPVLIPNTIVIAWRRRVFAPLTAAFLAMFILGLGGTTPIPRLVLGEVLWKTLTFDKFLLWASLLYTPLLAVMLRDRGVFVRRYYEGKTALKRSSGALDKWVKALFLGGLIATSVLASASTYLFNLQPPQPPLQPVADFLNAQGRDGRYLTLGFGTWMKKLSVLTDKETFDGGSNIARLHPILTVSGIETLDGAKYFPNGLATLDRVLANAEGLRIEWVFLNDRFYDDLLVKQGFQRLREVEGSQSVTVWVKNIGQNVNPRNSAATYGTLQVIAWSVYPLATMLVAFALTLGSVVSRMRKG